MKKHILISIDESHVNRMPAMVEKLKGEGLEVRRSLPSLGIVSGDAEETKLSSLRDVDGVTSLEEEGGVEIAPPDSPIQ